jgi:ABC-type multidrug transport system fused ATPase/permease subunit
VWGLKDVSLLQEAKSILNGNIYILPTISYLLQVRFSVFYAYAKATGLIISFLIIFFLLASEGSLVSSKIWLARWSTDNVTTDAQRDRYLYVYAAFGFSQSFFTLISALLLAYGANVASNVLHDHLIVNIMHSPMSFFESTPIGRIVNRFSKDMYVIDDTVPRSLMSFWRCFFAVISAFFAISYATPIFLSVVFPMMVLYLFIQVSVRHGLYCYPDDFVGTFKRLSQ